MLQLSFQRRLRYPSQWNEDEDVEEEGKFKRRQFLLLH
jgi:hypothetical protein